MCKLAAVFSKLPNQVAVSASIKHSVLQPSSPHIFLMSVTSDAEVAFMENRNKRPRKEWTVFIGSSPAKGRWSPVCTTAIPPPLQHRNAKEVLHNLHPLDHAIRLTTIATPLPPPGPPPDPDVIVAKYEVC